MIPCPLLSVVQGAAPLPPDPKVGEKRVRKVEAGPDWEGFIQKDGLHGISGAAELVAIFESGEGPEAEAKLGMQHCSWSCSGESLS